MTRKSPSELSLASAAYARAVRLGTPDDVAAARTTLNEAKVRAWIERTLAKAPPHLTPATEAKLVSILTAEGQS